MSCENDECNELILSSDVQFDGSFVNIVINEGADLSEVLLLMEQYFNSTLISLQNVTYTLGSGTCLSLGAGIYGFQEILDDVITKLCDTATIASASTDTDDVELSGGIVVPSCLSDFVGTLSTDLFNYIMDKLCEIIAQIPPQDTGVILPDGTSGWQETVNGGASMKMVESLHQAYADNHYYVFEHTTPVVSASSLNTTIQPIKAVIEDVLVARFDTKVVSFNASKDVYVVLDKTGTISLIEQTIGNPPPVLTADDILLYEIETDGSGVVSFDAVFDTSPFDAPIFTINPDTITTAMIQGKAVTSDKLADVITGATKGHTSIISITYNDQGQITAVTSLLSVVAPVNGQTLIYNSGTGAYENADNVTVVSTKRIPKSDGTDYVDSAIEEGASDIKVTKRLEVNTGVAENDTNAILNLVGGTFIVPRFTAAAASALVGVVDATMIYATTTDATFVSVGFWGYENGVWVKL